MAQPRRRAAQAEPCQLQPHRPRAGAKAAVEVRLAGAGATQLAAGGLQHRSGRHQHHVVGRTVDQRRRQLLDAALQRLLPLRVGLASLGHHHHPLGRPARVGHAEDDHATLADAGQFADRGLQFERVQVVAGADDEILVAAGDEEFAAGQIAEVAGVAPVAVEQLRRGLGVAEVAGGGRRAAELDPTLLPLRQQAAVAVDDADLVAGQRRAAGDDGGGLRVAFRHRLGAPGEHQRFAVDAVDAHAAPRRRKGEVEPALGQAVHGRDRARVEAVGRQPLREARQRVGAHRLGAIEGPGPARQIQPFEFALVEPRSADLVGKVRRRRDRAAVTVDRAQPARRPGEEGQRRHQHQVHAVVQAPHPGADQPHVVIQRQPGDEHLARAGADGAAHRPQVGEQLRVGEHHSFRAAGAAGGVLQQRQVPGVALGARGERLGVEFVRRQHVAQRRRQRLQQVRQRLGLGDGDEQRRLAVGKDPGLPLQVVFERRRARRWIQRHRHGAGIQRAVERDEELQRRRQHQRAGLPGRQAVRAQRRCRLQRPPVQFAVGERFAALVVDQQRRVHALRMPRHMPVEHLGERRRVVGAAGEQGRDLGSGGRPGRRSRGGRDMERRQDLARRADAGEGIVVEPAAERLLAAQVQFHAREAVDAEVLGEPAVERDLRRRRALRLGHQRPQQLEQQARAVVGRACGCGGLTQGLGHLVSLSRTTRRVAGGEHRAARRAAGRAGGMPRAASRPGPRPSPP